MNDRRYRFEDDLEENNRIYEKIKKDVIGNKSITTEQINRLANSTWLSSNKNINRCISIINKIKTSRTFETEHKEYFIHFLRLLSRSGDLVINKMTEDSFNEEDIKEAAKLIESGILNAKFIGSYDIKRECYNTLIFYYDGLLKNSKFINKTDETLKLVIDKIVDNEIKNLCKSVVVDVISKKLKIEEEKSKIINEKISENHPKDYQQNINNESPEIDIINEINKRKKEYQYIKILSWISLVLFIVFLIDFISFRREFLSSIGYIYDPIKLYLFIAYITGNLFFAYSFLTEKLGNFSLLPLWGPLLMGKLNIIGWNIVCLLHLLNVIKA